MRGWSEIGKREESSGQEKEGKFIRSRRRSREEDASRKEEQETKIQKVVFLRKGRERKLFWFSFVCLVSFG